MATKRPTIAASETGDPLLLTPGPLTTSRTVKQAMVHDWGSRDATFIKINQIGADAAAGDRPTLTRHSRHGADAGFGHLRGRGDAHDLRSARLARCCC